MQPPHRIPLISSLSQTGAKSRWCTTRWLRTTTSVARAQAGTAAAGRDWSSRRALTGQLLHDVRALVGHMLGQLQQQLAGNQLRSGIHLNQAGKLALPTDRREPRVQVALQVPFNR